VSAVLIISFLLLTAISFAIYRSKRWSSNASLESGPAPRRPRSLFDERILPEESKNSAADRRREEFSKLRAALLARAAQGDKDTLREARTIGDPSLYSEVLDALLGQAGSSTENLCALASYITRSEDLRSNTKLVESLIEAWKRAPGEVPLAEVLHVAALSDDAAVYQKACEAALQFWRNNSVPFTSAKTLYALIESQYWVLAPQARSSGAGFVLKQTLAEARRELTIANAP